MVLESTAASLSLLVGRVLFGGMLAFMGLNHFTDADGMSGYASAKGVPAAGILVPLTGLMLVLGGLGIVLGLYPVVAAAMLAAFLLVATPKMHDFWNAPEGERQGEMINFLKNVAVLGGALAFLALGTTTWGYALDVGLW